LSEISIEPPPPFDDLTPKQRISRLWAISAPIILALSSQNLLNIVDTWIVGQLGSRELAAVAMGATTNWMLSAFFIGMGAGVQAIVARRVGEGQLDGAVGALNRALNFSLTLVVPFSLFATFFSDYIMDWITTADDIDLVGTPYLAARLSGLAFVSANFAFRGYWNGLSLSRLYLRTLVVIHLVNVVLSYLLVFGVGSFEGWDVFGAGMGSTIAQAVGTLYYCHIASRHGVRKGFLQKNHSVSLRQLIRLGGPFGIQTLLFSLGFFIFFIITDHVGPRELGASQVLVTMSLVCILPGVGMGLGVASFVGQCLGANRPKDARKWGWLAMKLAVGICGSIGLVTAATASLWMTWFIPSDPVAAAMGIPALQVVGLVMTLDAVGIVLSNAMVGAGATKLVLIWSVTCQYGVFLPLAYLSAIVLGWSLTWMWVAFAIYRITFSVISVILWRSKHWQSAKV